MGLHRGTVLAALIVGLLVAAITAWMVMSPLVVESYAATLRNPQTATTVVCRVRAQELEHPYFAFTLCFMACRDHGFEPVTRVSDYEVDFRDAASRQRTMLRFSKFIPAACRDA